MTDSKPTAANPQQLKAIAALDGPVLIIAGPGSGKTFTLVERIVALVQTRGVKPEQLLVATFTEKAARELVTRVSNRLLELGLRLNINEMYIGTFHSICFRWLDEFREHTRLKKSYSLIDAFEQRYMLFQELRRFQDLEDSILILGEPKRGGWEQSGQLQSALNKFTEEALDAQALTTATDPIVRALAHCVLVYQTLMQEQNLLDFSGIQWEALQLLQNHESVRTTLQSRLAYLMVDEYQDTNTVQERILHQLVDARQNLCVVGDDDQGLYRFRGATIRNILEFPSQFASGLCKQVRLTVNYRSHPDIIRFYNAWMAEQEWTHEGTRFRFDKQIEARADTFPDAPAVLRLGGHPRANDPGSWHSEVLAFIHGLQAAGTLTDLNQVALLFRSVRADRSQELARFLEANGIAVHAPRSAMFFERSEVRLMIGALMFLFPQLPQARKWNADAHLEIWNYFDNECFLPFTDALRRPENKSLLEWARVQAKKHLSLKANADYAFTGLFYQLLRFPLFAGHVSEQSVASVERGRAARNLARLSGILSQFEYLHHVSVLNPSFLESNLQALFNRYLRFLYDGGIEEFEDEHSYAPSGCVSMMTIHQSKGLEFPVVLVNSLSAVPRKQSDAIGFALEQGGYLSKPSFEPAEQIKHYDFRRLFYTAFSRAQNLLVLSTHEQGGVGRSPSKYFDAHYRAIPVWNHAGVNLAAHALADVKQLNPKREYSFTSHLTVFENCAEQYRFFKDLDFTPVRAGAQLFGTLVHQTIEDIHKCAIKARTSAQPAQIDEDRIRTWFKHNYATLSQRERQYLAKAPLDAALQHVLNYFKREGKKLDRVREAEVDISLVKDNYILTGSVDLIRGRDDTVEIVDFKGERKPDLVRDNTRIKQYEAQLMVYAHLVEERTGHTVSKMHLYYTGEESGNPMISFDKNAKAIDSTIKNFDSVVARIEAKDYAMIARPPKRCESCDLKHYCDHKVWKFKKA
jgi:DNA helicase II / ATP-dependent DNA helicase PcrA